VSEEKPYRDAGNYTGTVPWTYEGIQVAALLSIRDELRKLNTLLHCPNFTGIPQTLRDIKKNTTKRSRKSVLKIKP
jgi:hypothetical protein